MNARGATPLPHEARFGWTGRLRTTLFTLAAASIAAISAAAPSQQPATPPTGRFLRAGKPTALPEPAATGAARIQAAALAAHIAFLASPSLAGRGLASEGLEAALDYVASSLALSGVRPLFAGADEKTPYREYFQPVPIREVSTLSGYVSLEIPSPEGPRIAVFLSGTEILLPAVARLDVDAPVAFARYGIREPTLGHDDYAGLDVRGKVVVILAGTPSGPQWQSAALQARYAAEDLAERHVAKHRLAEELGVAALLAIEEDQWTTAEAAEQSSRVLFFPTADGRRAEPPLLRASPVVGAFLRAAAGRPLTELDQRFLAGGRVRLVAAGTEREVTSRNVLALLEGSDPCLREHAVVIGAHVDHLGRIAGVIHPGADDNASGVAAVLEIAKAFAASPQRPKRTLVFAFWTGEEEGKLGSGHYVRHPLWPLTRTVACVNLDMIGHRFSLKEIKELVEDAKLPDATAFLAGLQAETFVEIGLPDTPPELADAVLRAAAGIGVDLHLDFTDGTNGGSDYRDFARAGVPFLRFFGNFFPGYHNPDDTPANVDVSATEQQARLAFATAWLLADPQ